MYVFCMRNLYSGIVIVTIISLWVRQWTLISWRFEYERWWYDGATPCLPRRSSTPPPANSIRPAFIQTSLPIILWCCVLYQRCFIASNFDHEDSRLVKFYGSSFFKGNFKYTLEMDCQRCFYYYTSTLIFDTLLNIKRQNRDESFLRSIKK